MNNLEHYIWPEKYRPKNLDEIVLEESIKNKFLKFQNDGEIPHLLLVGSAGIGKSSISRIIVRDLLDCEYIHINASDKSGVDVIRTEVKSFASSASLDEKIKVVILGEADGLSKTAQNSLKEMIEDYSETTRFIFTANNLSKLSEPIVSRCQRIDLKYDSSSFLAHCIQILKKEGIEISPPVLKDITQKCFPDFRLTLNELQRNIQDGKQVAIEKENTEFVVHILGLLGKHSPHDVRVYLRKNSIQFESYTQLMMDIAEHYFRTTDFEFNRNLILLLNKFLYQDTTHPDKELNFYCLLIELKGMKN